MKKDWKVIYPFENRAECVTTGSRSCSSDDLNTVKGAYR